MIYATVEFEAGETIFHQGDRGRFMYVVQEGEVEVLQELEGEEQPIAVLERGDFFGEMAILEEEPRSHAVKALGAVRLIKIDAAGLQHTLERNPEIAVRMIRKLRKRLTALEERLLAAHAAGARPAEQRAGREARFVHLPDGSEIVLPTVEEVRIGRPDPARRLLPDVDLTPFDPKLASSRRHARLLRRGERLLVVEDQATNGTYVNGRRLAPGEPVELRPGDEVTFGAVKLRFEA